MAVNSILSAASSVNTGLSAISATSSTTSNSLASTSDGKEIKSVFDLEYIPTSKAAEYNIKTTGYFTIGVVPNYSNSKTNKTPNETAGATGLMSKIKSKLLNTVTAANYDTTNFWQIIINNLVESHEETYSIHNTISDSVSIYSTGSKPIAISMSAYLLVSGTEDYQYEFLKKYISDFRARHLTASNKHLLFVLQDTEFNLILHSISMSTSEELETYIPITLSGIAYNYRTINSTEPFVLGYYGKNKNQEAKDPENVFDKVTKLKNNFSTTKTTTKTAVNNNPPAISNTTVSSGNVFTQIADSDEE